MTVLISTIPGDFHVDAVKWGLDQLGVEVFIWMPSDVPDKAQATINLENDCSLALTCGGNAVSLNDISVFWNRRKSAPRAPERANTADVSTINVQSMEHCSNVEVILGEYVPAINSPTSKLLANSKAYQLKLARSVGFLTPDTIISNDPGAVRNFLQKNGAIVAKPFKPSSWQYNGRMLLNYTATLTDLSDISNKSIEWCPYIYQSLIESSYEVRVICFDNKLYGMKQILGTGTGPDARRNLRYGKAKVGSIEIPSNIRTCISSYLESMNLRYGAFDFGVDRDGNWTFFECNEAGQFLYLEAYVPEIKVLDSFCRWLASFDDPEKAARVTTIELRDFDEQRSSLELATKVDAHKHVPLGVSASVEMI